METVLCLLHTEADGTLGKPAREALGAARELTAALAGARLEVGLVGGALDAAGAALAGCGAAAVRGVEGDGFAVSRYATDAAAAAALARAAAATLVVAPATSRWNRVLPGVAVRLDGRIDTQIVGFDTGAGTLQVRRWFYRQRLLATLSRGERPWLWLLAGGAFPPWDGAAGADSAALDARPGGGCERLAVDLPAGALDTRVIGEEAAAGATRTIDPDAELLLVAGAGWTKRQADGAVHVERAQQLILGFIERAHASLGSSKSLVEQASEGTAVLPFLSHLNQVGQTGATPRHPRGLATCCHGEEPHVVGWRFIGERRAINTDPNCGWAQGKADVVYVADAFEVMAQVNALLADGA